MRSQHVVLGGTVAVLGMVGFYVFLFFAIVIPEMIYLSLLSLAMICAGPLYFMYIVPQNEQAKERQRTYYQPQNQLHQRFCHHCGHPNTIVGSRHCISCGIKLMDK